MNDLLTKCQYALNNIQNYMDSIDDEALLDEDIETIQELLDLLRDKYDIQ